MDLLQDNPADKLLLKVIESKNTAPNLPAKTASPEIPGKVEGAEIPAKTEIESPRPSKNSPSNRVNATLRGSVWTKEGVNGTLPAKFH